MTRAVLDDFRTAPIDDRLRAVLGFLEKLTLTPEAVGPEDVDALREAGLDDDAIRDAAYVCVTFSVIDRLADAFAFEVPPEDSFRRRADKMLAARYALPRLTPS